MYELVKTTAQKNLFDQIWTESWISEGYEVEETASPFAQLLLKKGDQVIGTLEFNYAEGSESVKTFPFESYANLDEKAFELDKLTILREHRGREALKLVAATIAQFAEEIDASCLIALTEPRLAIAFRRYFRINVVALGESFFYKGDDVTPVLFKTRELFEEKARIAELLKPKVLS